MRHLSVGPRCERCFLKPVLCICDRLLRVETRTHVAFVTHKMEHAKSTNTGRLARACLPNSSVTLFGNDLPPLPDMPWPAGHRPFVLFPLRGAPVTTSALLDGDGPPALVVLDGTWRQANRWRKRFLTARVPFVVPPLGPPSVYRLRTERTDETLSTLEAVARALAAIEGRGDIEDSLVVALRLFQDRTLWARGALSRDAVFGGLPDGLVSAP